MRTPGNFGLGVVKLLIGVLLAGGAIAFGNDSQGPSAAAKNDAAAKAAFLAAYPVLMHPRCLNCHPAGDMPLQGEDSHLHTQNVQRGRAGMGKYALRCNNCHQPANVPGENMPPGTANWHLAPRVMVFEGRSAGELCRQMKDPKTNGGHPVEGAIEHLESDPLVLWGWSPGDGRSTPPLSHAEFLQKMQEWVRSGAACPD